MSRFPTAGHLISWAGLCPGNDESAGKRRSTRMRKGAPWLKTVLIQCAWAGARKKGGYLEAQFHRLRARRGAKKAVGAVAACSYRCRDHPARPPDHADSRQLACQGSMGRKRALGHRPLSTRVGPICGAVDGRSALAPDSRPRCPILARREVLEPSQQSAACKPPTPRAHRAWS